MTVVEEDLLNIDVTDARSKIPSLKDIVYFNSGWTGPMPKSALEKVQKSLEYQQETGPSTKEGVKAQISEILEAKNNIIKFFGVDSKTICLTVNTTLGINLALNAFNWNEEDEIISTKNDHASVLIPLCNLQDRYGTKIKLIDVDYDNPLESFRKNISKNTKAAVFCHLFWTDGNLLPLKEIISELRNNSIISIIDGAQSAGAVDFNLRDSGVDFYAVPGQKWLLGPIGTGFLYIRDELHAQRPPWPTIVGYESAGDTGDDSGYSLDLTWKAKKHAGVFEFGGLNNSLFCGLSESLKFAMKHMEEFNIYKRINALSNYLISGLKDIARIKVITYKEHAGLVSWQHENVSSREVVSRLWKETRILIREIENFNYCRASLHYFNTKEEIDLLLDNLRKF